jgi:hypothetical protein
VNAVRAVDDKDVEKLVINLNSNSFTVRTGAVEPLQKLAEIAEPAPLKAFDGRPSLEVQRRIEPLLRRVQERESSVDWLRMVRAVQALEYMKTVESRQALKSLADGEPKAWLTRGARPAVDRLSK